MWHLAYNIFSHIDVVTLAVFARWLCTPVHFWRVSKGISKSGCRWETEVRLMTEHKTTFRRQLCRATQLSRHQAMPVSNVGVCEHGIDICNCVMLGKTYAWSFTHGFLMQTIYTHKVIFHLKPEWQQNKQTRKICNSSIKITKTQTMTVVLPFIAKYFSFPHGCASICSPSPEISGRW